MKNLRMGESCRRIFRETSLEQQRDFGARSIAPRSGQTTPPSTLLEACF